MIRRISFAAAALMLAGCGTDTAVYEATAAELDTVTAERDAAYAERDTAIEQLAMTLDEMKGDADEAAEELAAAERRARSMEMERDSAVRQAEDLLIQFDPEIRAVIQEEWANEADRACQEAASGTARIASYVRWDDTLDVLGTEAELVAEVEACAEPLRARSTAERLADECEPVSVDAVTKSPDGLAGTCYVMFVIPWQWDSRTGECTFLGSFDPANLGTRRYQYDGDGLFAAPDATCERDLGDADQDDLLKVWATLIGAWSYETAAGGTNEVPQFAIQGAEVVRKA